MEKKPFLPKHCKTSKNGSIGLSNTLVETALKIHNCPIKVTCNDYPGQISTYSVTDLLTPIDKRGPFINQYVDNATYWIYIYPWKGEPIETPKFEDVSTEIVQEAEPNVSVVLDPNNKNSREYIIETPITEIKKTKVTFIGYVGFSLRKHRKAKKLTQEELSNLTNGEVSTTSISQIETATTNPVLSSIEALAIALNIHVSELFPPKN